MSGENIFIKIRNEEKNQIYQDLAASKLTVSAKFLDPISGLFELKAESFMSEKLTLTSRSMQAQLPSPTARQPMIVQFSVGSEKYLAQVDTQFDFPYITMHVNSDLFRLQRREDFRLKIPASFKAEVTVTLLNTKPGEPIKKIAAQVQDMSAGGLKLILKKDLLPVKKDDQLKADLKLAGRNTILLQLKVLHVANDPVNEKNIIAGCQFTNLNPIEKNRLSALVMDLYREIYSRL